MWYKIFFWMGIGMILDVYFRTLFSDDSPSVKRAIVVAISLEVIVASAVAKYLGL